MYCVPPLKPKIGFLLAYVCYIGMNVRIAQLIFFSTTRLDILKDWDRELVLSFELSSTLNSSLSFLPDTTLFWM